MLVVRGPPNDVETYIKQTELVEVASFPTVLITLWERSKEIWRQTNISILAYC